MIEQALLIAEKAHHGQTDKAGKPYIEHPKRVAQALQTVEEKMAGLLHDVIEDTKLTAEDLINLGMPEVVVEAVVALTKQPGETYDAFIDRVKTNPLAVRVKMADIGDNMNLDRLEKVTDEDLARNQKYEKALKKLSKK